MLTGAMLGFVALCSFFVFTQYSLGLTPLNTSKIQLACIVVFSCAFEMSFGAIFWLYTPEITTNKGMSLAVAMNWGCSVMIG